MRIMTADLEKVRELHAWNRRIMSVGGCWPLEPSYVKFYIGYLYFTLQMMLVINDLVNVFGDMSLVVANLSESTLQLMVGVKMLVLRHSAPLVKIVKQVEDGANEENYRDQKEKSLYLEYTDVGRIFFRVLGCVAFSTEVTYLFGPFEDIIKAAVHNETMPYTLPYRIRLFFNMTDTRTYAFVYATQAPMFYFYYFHTISICFLCTIIVHVAGELSILAYRIRNINNADSLDDYCDLESTFRDITIKHLQIIETAQTIDDIFNVVLMEELVITTVLIGLTAYNVLLKSAMTSMFEFMSFVTYAISMIGLILIYCITGDFLMRESINVQDAYYECRWYTMPSKYRKHMMICMIRAKRPLQLTAGRFYIFELSRFSSVLKTSMAYISMLRTVV